MQDKDFDTMAAVIDDNVVYHNVGLPIITGGHRVLKFLRRGLRRPNVGFQVKIHRIAAEGTSVLTERTDAVLFGPFRVQFWVCGVFEVRGGRITLWRDYFDFFDIFKAAVRGVLALAVPSLRQNL
jgi:limonene-1,2-epoxide hydrolase